MWMGDEGVGTRGVSPGASSTHIRWDRPSLAPMVVTISVSGSSSTLNLRSYSEATAARSFGMPRLDEDRWFFGLCTASASLSTAASGEGMSGLPNARSITSSPARRAAIFKASISARTYGGRPVMRRNSMKQILLLRGRTSTYAIRDQDRSPEHDLEGHA